jgi:hypothetical protein
MLAVFNLFRNLKQSAFCNFLGYVVFGRSRGKPSFICGTYCSVFLGTARLPNDNPNRRAW